MKEEKESNPSPENQRRSLFNVKWNDIKSNGEPRISNFERFFNIDLAGDNTHVKQLTMQVLLEDDTGKENEVNVILFKKENYDFYYDNSKIIAKENNILIDYIRPNLYVSPSIALIGSSKRLLNKPYGNEIDSYDEVVRFNRAPVYGFEAYVGHKTTFRAVNCHVFSNQAAPGFNTQPQNFVKNLHHTKILILDHTVPTLSQIKEHTHDSTTMHSFFSEDHTFDERVNASPWRSTKPEDIEPKDPNNNYKKLIKKYNMTKSGSLGLNMILLLINSGVVPHLFGFDLDTHNNNHYWEDRPPPSNEHNLKVEKILLRKMIEEGKVIYHE